MLSDRGGGAEDGGPAAAPRPRPSHPESQPADSFDGLPFAAVASYRPSLKEDEFEKFWNAATDAGCLDGFAAKTSDSMSSATPAAMWRRRSVKSAEQTGRKAANLGTSAEHAIRDLSVPRQVSRDVG